MWLSGLLTQGEREMGGDEDFELSEVPVPDDRLENLLAFALFWVAIIGLVFPAWVIGAPWGWFAYAGTVVLVCGFMELRQLNNILVRTLPALRLLLVEARRLRNLEERRVSHDKG